MLRAPFEEQEELMQLQASAFPCAGSEFSNPIPADSPTLCVILMRWRWSSPLTALRADNSYRTFAGGLYRDRSRKLYPQLSRKLSLDRPRRGVGASARYFLSTLIASNFSSAFPYGTLLINITGSLVLGFFLVFSTERALLDPRWRLLVAIGFCGSYTTFSSYAFESFAFMEQGQWLMTGINIVASNALCLAAVMAGAALARGL